MTLEFTDDEENRAKMAVNGDSAHFALSEIYNECRLWVKHGDCGERLSDEEIKRLDKLRKICFDLVNDVE